MQYGQNGEMIHQEPFYMLGRDHFEASYRCREILNQVNEQIELASLLNLKFGKIVITDIPLEKVPKDKLEMLVKKYYPKPTEKGKKAIG